MSIARFFQCPRFGAATVAIGRFVAILHDGRTAGERGLHGGDQIVRAAHP